MKRIICSILVVVMLAISLVSCGYSFTDDNMTKYAEFKTQANFEELLKKIVIKDGDFTTDPATREAKVLENIYEAIAEAVKTDAEKKTEGKPGERDVVYYSYYATAVFEEVTAYFYGDKMKSSSAESLQLRPSLNYGEDELSAEIAKILAESDFDVFDYTATTSGKTAEGDVAYVTFTKTVGDQTPVVYTNYRMVIGASSENPTTFDSYLCGKSINSSIDKFEEKDGETVTATYSSIKVNWVSSRDKTGTVSEGDQVYVSYTKKVGETTTKATNKKLTVGAAVAEGETAATLESYLAGKKIATTLDKLTVTEDGASVEYSDIIIDWRTLDESKVKTATLTPFDEETKVKDSTGTERDLKDVELTYYVYPVNYISIPEYSAEVLIDTVFGEELKEDTLYEIIFAERIAALDDDATEDDRNKIKEDAVNYKTSEGLSIADLVKKIVKYYEDIKTAQTTLDNADEALTKAKSTYEEAKLNLETEQNSGAPDAEKVAELEAALKTAEESLKTAETNQKTAQDKYDGFGTEKKENINKLLEIVGVGETENLRTKIYRNYKVVTYEYLQSVYNAEIKNNLAKEIYFFLTENIVVGDKLPEKAVEEAYTQIYETYENDFYTGTYDSTNKISNYKQYKGDFDKFLISKVSADIKTVNTVKEAKAAIKEKAREDVKPMVEIFLAAQAYDMVLTDKEYEAYKDELEDYYYYYVLYYKNFSIESMLGKTNMKIAAQFNKLMDWFLEYEEHETPKDENGYVKIEYHYTNPLFGEYTTEGVPASEKTETE